MKKRAEAMELIEQLGAVKIRELEDDLLEDVLGSVDCGSGCECNSVDGCGEDHNYVAGCGSPPEPAQG